MEEVQIIILKGLERRICLYQSGAIIIVYIVDMQVFRFLFLACKIQTALYLTLPPPQTYYPLKQLNMAVYAQFILFQC